MPSTNYKPILVYQAITHGEIYETILKHVTMWRWHLRPSNQSKQDWKKCENACCHCTLSRVVLIKWNKAISIKKDSLPPFATEIFTSLCGELNKEPRYIVSWSSFGQPLLNFIATQRSVSADGVRRSQWVKTGIIIDSNIASLCEPVAFAIVC